jgi:hypothetical protein
MARQPAVKTAAALFGPADLAPDEVLNGVTAMAEEPVPWVGEPSAAAPSVKAKAEPCRRSTWEGCRRRGSAFLEGELVPQTRQETDFEAEDRKVGHSVAAKAPDYRGLNSDPGAGPAQSTALRRRADDPGLMRLPRRPFSSTHRPMRVRQPAPACLPEPELVRPAAR